MAILTHFLSDRSRSREVMIQLSFHSKLRRHVKQILASHIEESTAIKDVSDLLILMKVFLEEALDLGFIRFT